MKTFKELKEKSYRFTTYSLDMNGGAGKASFLEYLNSDELDDYMLTDKIRKKHSNILIVRSDGSYVQYKDSGSMYTPSKKGKDVMKDFKGKLNKKPDLS